MASFSSARETGPVYARLNQKLRQQLDPIHLEIEDESHKHAGHAAMRNIEH